MWQRIPKAIYPYRLEQREYKRVRSRIARIREPTRGRSEFTDMSTRCSGRSRLGPGSWNVRPSLQVAARRNGVP